MLKKAFAWLLARLYEPSTWAGLSSASLAVGVYLQQPAGGATGAVVAAVMAFIKSEKGAT